MARVGLRKVVFGLAATGLLIGCVEGGGKTGVDAAQVSAPSKKSGGARDIEAPEIYQATDSALWDGRPSLGGIWVAASDVVNPERVVIFNPASGKSITGALFKRERENPGPRLQLSSDAAEALGILAGQPTEIRVTALRKEEVAEPAANAETDPAAKPAPEGAEAAAIASAALDAVDSGTVDAGTAPAPAPEGTDVSGEVAVAAAVAAEGAADLAADAAPKPKTWKERRAEAKAAREAKRRAAAEAKAAAAAAAAGAAAPVEGEVATADSAAAAPIESAPLDARTPDVGAPTVAANAGTTVAPAAVKPAAPAAAADPAPSSAAGGAVRPIQVASFSKEENANRAAEALAKIGITAKPQKSESNGKAVWGVVVMGDGAMLQKIKDAGFADAYYLK